MIAQDLERIIGKTRLGLEKGHTILAMMCLTEAEKLAGKERMSELKILQHQVYKAAVDHYLDIARFFAEDGHEVPVSANIWCAEQYASKIGMVLPKEAITKLRRTAYGSRYKQELEIAIRRANGKDADGAFLHLGNAKFHAKAVGVVISSEVINDIESLLGESESIYYGRKVDEHLVKARGEARIGGRLRSVLDNINKARTYARAGGIEIDHSDIEKMAYEREHEHCMQDAARYSEEGDCVLVEKRIEQANEYGARVGLAVPEETARMLLLTAERNGVKYHLNAARRSAEIGEIIGLKTHLVGVVESSMKLGEKIPKEAMDEIIGIAKAHGVSDGMLNHLGIRTYVQ